MTIHKVLHPRDDIDRLYTRTEEDSAALKIASMLQNLKSTLKKQRSTNCSDQKGY